VTLAQLAERISGNADVGGRPVIDRTGMSGSFDLDLNWLPEDVAGAAERQGRVAQGPRLADALEEQLGLRLQSVTAPIDVVVVEHIERPTAN
jgi:uncharacterized protein (TIGR03435 family)